MLELNLKPYEQFKKMKFENLIGESINTELVKDLWGINEKYLNNNARCTAFKETYKLSYLGEVLERYEERGIVKTTEDLRALLVYTCYSLQYEMPEINTNQLEVFLSKVEELSILNKDVFSIGVLLQKHKFRENISDDRNLCSILIKEIETNNNLSFEEKVWGMYSCWSYLSCIKEFSNSDNLLGKLEDVDNMKKELLDVISGIEIRPLKHLGDYYLYIMLAKIANSEAFFEKSKNFKNKAVCNQYKKLISLVKKEYKEDTVESLLDVFDMSKEDLFFYNYVLSRKDYLCYIDGKVTSKGEMRLYNKLLDRLSSTERCSEIIVDKIREKIEEISKEKDSSRKGYYYTPTKGIDKAREIVFKEFSGTVSAENFDIFMDLTGIGHDDYIFFNSSKYVYIFSKNYEKFLDKIYWQSTRELAHKCISAGKNKELVKNALKYLEKNDRKHELNHIQYKILYKLEILDSNSDSKYDSRCVLKGYLLHREDVLSKEEFLKELKDIYNNFDEIEARVKGHIGKSDFISVTVGLLIDMLDDINIFGLAQENSELAREYQVFKDELNLLYKSTFDYFKYIVNLLENKDYINLMSLSESDVAVLLKNIYDAINDEYFLEKNYCASGMLRKLEGLVLSEEEKEAKKIEEELENLKENTTLRNVEYALRRDFIKNNKSCVLKVKEVFLKSIEEDVFSDDYFSLQTGYRIVKKLVELEEFNDQELLDFSKKCLMHV